MIINKGGQRGRRGRRGQLGPSSGGGPATGERSIATPRKNAGRLEMDRHHQPSQATGVEISRRGRLQLTDDARLKRS